MIRIRGMGLLLGLVLLQGGFAGAALSQTTIERSRDIEVDTDSNLPEFEGDSVSQEDLGAGTAAGSEPAESSEVAESSATEENTIEFTPSTSASSSAPESSAIVRYNIRKNVCTGNWSMSELNSLFPTVDAAMVRDVCG
ncbi:MAG: hypothetical protein AB4050_00095 [Synechococcus sp.]